MLGLSFSRLQVMTSEDWEAVRQETLAHARKLGREAREREEAEDPTGWKCVAARFASMVRSECIDENDYDEMYHRGAL